MTWLTSKRLGERGGRADARLSPMTMASTRLCSARYGRSCRKLARGPSSGLPPNGERRPEDEVSVTSQTLPRRISAEVV